MEHEKIIKRENGTQYKITVNLIVDSFRRNANIWRFDVYFREKGKKNWNSLPNTLHDHNIRSLSLEDRDKQRIENAYRFVTEEEVLSAKLELWENIKPTF